MSAALIASTAASVSGSSAKLTTQVTVDLHGYHPDQVTGYPLESLIQQAWEMGVDRLRLIHGGRTRPVRRQNRPAGVNTGFLGEAIRNELSHPRREMRRYMGSTIVSTRDPVLTVISIRKNSYPTRDELDLSALPATRERQRYEEDWAWAQNKRAA